MAKIATRSKKDWAIAMNKEARNRGATYARKGGKRWGAQDFQSKMDRMWGGDR